MNLSALNSFDFKLYLTGNFFFLHGLWAQRIVLSWIAWELTKSPSYVGLTAFLSLAPTFISGPLFGVLADRVKNIKNAALLSYCSMILCSLLLFLSSNFNFLSPLILAIFCLLIGIIASASHPIRMALAPRLVIKDQLPSVVALTSVNFNISRLVGPAIGGSLILTTGINNTILLTIFFYIPILFVMMLIKPRLIDSNNFKKNQTLISSLIEGAKLTTSHQLIRFSIMISGLTAFVGRGPLETLPLIAEGMFSSGPYGLGIITASAGGGALLASLAKAIGASQKENTIPIDGIIAAVLIPLILILISLTQTFYQAAFLIFFLGFAATLVGISIQSLIQLELNDAYRGRVMSLWTMINMGAASIGAFLLGLISDLISIPNAQLIFGIIFGSIIILVLLYNYFLQAKI